jgi:hypothetical protein
MYTNGPRGAIDGQQIRSTLPYIKTDIPVVVIFRALGFVSDRCADDLLFLIIWFMFSLYLGILLSILFMTSTILK